MNEEIIIKRYHFDSNNKLVGTSSWGKFEDYNCTPTKGFKNESKVIDCKCTDLLDKTGGYIIESDFVKDSEETYLVCFGEWEYDTYSFIGWYLKNKSWSFGLSSKDCEQLEVIGNLYEHPNLINF